MKKRGLILVGILLLTMILPIHAAISIPTSTNAYVNDYMEVLSQDTINEINSGV